MKKLNLLLLSLTTLLVGVGLASCDSTPNTQGTNPGGGNKPNPNPNPGTDNPSVDPSADVEIKDGFTSRLAKATDKDINKPLFEQNGKTFYNVAGIDIEIKDTLNVLYTSDVNDKDKFNYLMAGHAESSEIYTSMLDGLFDNTKTKRLVGMLAIASKEDRTNAENPTFSYQLRKNVPWVVNSTGEIYEHEGKKQYIKAEDFVESAFYSLSLEGGTTTFLYTLFIKGAEEYHEWATQEENIEKSEAEKRAKFDELVGVKATEEDVISYTLTKDINYFETVTTYSPYYPVNRHFLAQKASNFGNTQDDILVSGPYRVTSYTKQAKLVYQANEHYWDKEHVYIKTINNIYYKSGQSADYTRNLFESGQIDSFSVAAADKIGWDKYIGEGNTVNTAKSDQVTPVEVKGNSIFFNFFVFNRKMYEYNNLIPKTEKQKQDTEKLMLNKDFRLGILYGTDYIKTRLTSIKTPHEVLYRRYVSENLAFDVDGKDYIDYFDEVYNEKNSTKVKLAGFDQGYDPVYNIQKAEEFFKKAYAELKTQGVEFPILLDRIGSTDIIGKQEEANRYRMLEELAKKATDENKEFIKFRHNQPQNDSQFSLWKNNSNADIDSTGWGPDYADPNTFLDTVKVNGGYAEKFGLKFNENKAKVENSEDKKVKDKAEQLFGDFTNKVNEANKITDSKERFKKLAEAEYSLIYEQGLIQPFLRSSRVVPSVSKIVPFQSAKVAYGNNSSRMKNTVVATEVLPRDKKLQIIKHFNELQGKVSEQATITFFNKDNGLLENYKGIPDTMTLTKGQTLSLPQSIKDDGSRKVIRKWYTDSSLTNEVENKDGVIVVTGNLSLYAKEEDINVMTSIELSVNNADENFAKHSVAVDNTYEYPIYASDTLAYLFDVKPQFTNDSNYLDDNVVVEVLPTNPQDELNKKVAEALTAVYTPSTKVVALSYPSANDKFAYAGQKVKLVIKAENLKEGENAKKELTFVLSTVKQLENIFVGEQFELVKPSDAQISEVTIKNNEVISKVENQEKYEAKKVGSTTISFKLSNDKVDFKHSVEFEVAERFMVGEEIDLSSYKESTIEVSNSQAVTVENGVVTIAQLGHEVTVTIKKGEQTVRTFKIKTIAKETDRAKTRIRLISARIKGEFTGKKAELKAVVEAKIKELEALLEKIESTEEKLAETGKALVDAYYEFADAK